MHCKECWQSLTLDHTDIIKNIERQTINTADVRWQTTAVKTELFLNEMHMQVEGTTLPVSCVFAWHKVKAEGFLCEEKLKGVKMKTHGEEKDVRRTKSY